MPVPVGCPARSAARRRGGPVSALVLYDSVFGNTAQIAQAIARGLGAYGAVRLVGVAQAHPQQLEAIDLLVLGCPTQHHGLSPATSLLLDHVLPREVTGLSLAVFDT